MLDNCYLFCFTCEAVGRNGTVLCPDYIYSTMILSVAAGLRTWNLRWCDITVDYCGQFHCQHLDSVDLSSSVNFQIGQLLQSFRQSSSATYETWRKEKRPLLWTPTRDVRAVSHGLRTGNRQGSLPGLMSRIQEAGKLDGSLSAILFGKDLSCSGKS